MATKITIGPYSAYAIAVKYGYTGTEEEWIREIEDARANVDAAKGYADQAALSNARAGSAASRAEEAAGRAEAIAPSDGAVLSVNGKGGAVVLTAADVSAVPEPLNAVDGGFLRILSVRSDGTLVVDAVTVKQLKELLAGS